MDVLAGGPKRTDPPPTDESHRGHRHHSSLPSAARTRGTPAPPHPLTNITRSKEETHAYARQTCSQPSARHHDGDSWTRVGEGSARSRTDDGKTRLWPDSAPASARVHAPTHRRDCTGPILAKRRRPHRRPRFLR